MKKLAFRALGFATYFCAFSALLIVPVQAYIDPSATTYIIQAVAAAVIAIGACFTIFRHKIASFFKGNKTAEKKEVVFKDADSENTEATESEK